MSTNTWYAPKINESLPLLKNTYTVHSSVIYKAKKLVTHIVTELWINLNMFTMKKKIIAIYTNMNESQT